MMTSDVATTAAIALGCKDGFNGYRFPSKRMRTSPLPFELTISVFQPKFVSADMRIGGLVIVLEEIKVKPDFVPRKTSMLQPPEPHQSAPIIKTTASISPSPSKSVNACWKLGA